jgi:hypothetical protein
MEIMNGFVPLSKFDRPGRGSGKGGPHSETYKAIRSAISTKAVRAYQDVATRRLFVNEDDVNKFLLQAKAKEQASEPEDKAIRLLKSFERLSSSVEYQEACIKDVLDLTREILSRLPPKSEGL